MATVSQVTARPVSGYDHIDALVGDAQPWNYTGRTVLYYSFSVTSGVESSNGSVYLGSRASFNEAQKAYTRSALSYVSQVTGIQFAETANGAAADIHFANADLAGYATGLASNAWSYQYDSSGQVTSLNIDSWIYLDNYDQVYTNLNPAPGTVGYETLLHEIGHALGLKHPFEGADTLPTGGQLGQDNSNTTLMSYTKSAGMHTTFSSYDLAALDWLYGRDGLGGARGVGSAGKFLTGSVGSDVLAGTAGADVIDGSGGFDTVVFAGNRGSHAIAQTGSSYSISAGGVTDTAWGVERLQFADQSVNLVVGELAQTISTGQLDSLVELYIAYLDRVPDADGMLHWINQLKAGQSLEQIGDAFYNSGVYFGNLTGYSAGMSNADFIGKVYSNVLGRGSVDAEGLAFWTGQLASGAESRASVVGTILGSAHTFKGDAQYGWVADLLDNKIAVGKEFAIDQGLVYNSSEASIAQGMAIADAITPTSTAAAISLIGVNDGFSLFG